jgi:UDP-N-acetyl-D-galactosamine dehydrogenase
MLAQLITRQQKILAADKHLSQLKMLVLGFTFKENVSNVPNTKVAFIVRELQSFRIGVDLVDSYADAREVMHEYRIEMKSQPEGTYDAIIVAVAHHKYWKMTEPDFLKFANATCLLDDVKGLYANRIKKNGVLEFVAGKVNGQWSIIASDLPFSSSPCRPIA